MYKIKKGIDLPIIGRPVELLSSFRKPKKIAINGVDYIGLRPTLLVKIGDVVRKGDPLIASKENLGVTFNSPLSGEVIEINRGPKRVLESVVISVSGEEERTFEKMDVENLVGGQVTKALVESGLFTAFRTRPFSRIPQVSETPSSIFVTAIDTDPLGFNPEIIIAKYFDDYIAGLTALSKLTDTLVNHVVHRTFSLDMPPISNCVTTTFSGKHPAGLVGTHIHTLDPVSSKKSVWHMGYQDVIAVGKLFNEGKLWTDRFVSIGGPAVKEPRILHTTLGADLEELTKDCLEAVSPRIISGSIFNGRRVEGNLRFLGRYDTKISVIEDHVERKLLGWIRPGLNTHSLSGAFLSMVFPKRRLSINSARNGSIRPVVPIGLFEKVFPIDILPTQLAKALINKDIAECLRLGILELDEEDVSLMTYACSGKNDYGTLLREMLDVIYKEGA